MDVHHDPGSLECHVHVNLNVNPQTRMATTRECHRTASAIHQERSSFPKIGRYHHITSGLPTETRKRNRWQQIQCTAEQLEGNPVDRRNNLEVQRHGVYPDTYWDSPEWIQQSEFSLHIDDHQSGEGTRGFIGSLLRNAARHQIQICSVSLLSVAVTCTLLGSPICDLI
jgi:hypothetical protein